MLLKPELTYADVIPKDVYFNRRKFLKAMGITGVAARRKESLNSAPVAKCLRCDKVHRSDHFSAPREGNLLPGRHALQYFYEFGVAKDQPAKFRTSVLP
jgi:hypothetical protein